MDKRVNTDNFAGLDEDTYNQLVGQLTSDQSMTDDDADDFCDGLYDVVDDDDSVEDA